MVKINELVKFISGSSQFRVIESNSKNDPIYQIFGQSELELDLNCDEQTEVDTKSIRTSDKVITLEADDIIFSLISGTTILVSQRHQGYFISQNYIKLKPIDKLDPKYLVFLLNEDIHIKKQFSAGLQGTSVIKFSVKQLKDLDLPNLPSLKDQALIGQLYFNQKRKNTLEKRVIDQQSKLFMHLLKGGIVHE